MLKIAQLNSFLQEVKTTVPEITDFRTMASEDRYTLFARDILHEDEDVYCIALIPSARFIGRNEDDKRFGNNLSFMIIRKLGDTPNSDAYDAAFNIAQDATLKLVDLILEKQQNEGNDCIFRDFDLNTIMINPVENFHQTNGFDLSMRLKTNR